MLSDALAFTIEPSTAPVPAEERAQSIADPGFGRVFTDHMALVRYSADRGWHDASVEARRPFSMDPSSAVLHYAQEIFEGLKAYRRPGGRAALFRPEANAERFRASARRMAMPELPADIFLQSIRALVRAEKDWIPEGPDGALYLRPFMIASEAFLGVRPAGEYLYAVIASSVGAYFRGGAKPVSVWATKDYIRAAPGGTGAAKCGGNYAASLAAQAEAIRNGCDQVVFLDAIERRWVEELGGMNIFFVHEDGSLLTPPLGGTILAGITRDSILTLARDMGLAVREERYSIADWAADAAGGRLSECFACGTAAVVTPIGRVRGEGLDIAVGGGEAAGPVTQRLRDALVGIQRGERPDPYGWIEEID